MSTQPAISSGPDKVVARAIEQIGDIGTLPEITLKIIATVEDPHSTARDLHEIVTHDLALSTRILRVVNSAFYGLPGQVASIERAIIMLGLNAVKNIAIAASLNRVFRGGRISRRYSARDLWVHAVAVGAASKMLVDELTLPLPDEAFVAGLLHDIGLVVMLQSNLPAMQELMRLTENVRDGESAGLPGDEQFRRAEQHLFGASHEAFGEGLSHQWKFPRSFHFVTGYHHRPGELERDNRLLTQIIHVADRLSAQLQIGMVLPVDTGPIAADTLSELGLTDAHLAAVREKLADQVAQAMQLLD